MWYRTQIHGILIIVTWLSEVFHSEWLLWESEIEHDPEIYCMLFSSAISFLKLLNVYNWNMMAMTIVIKYSTFKCHLWSWRPRRKCVHHSQDLTYRSLYVPYARYSNVMESGLSVYCARNVILIINKNSARLFLSILLFLPGWNPSTKKFQDLVHPLCIIGVITYYPN